MSISFSHRPLLLTHRLYSIAKPLLVDDFHHAQDYPFLAFFFLISQKYQKVCPGLFLFLSLSTNISFTSRFRPEVDKLRRGDRGPSGGHG